MVSCMKSVGVLVQLSAHGGNVHSVCAALKPSMGSPYPKKLFEDRVWVAKSQMRL